MQKELSSRCCFPKYNKEYLFKKYIHFFQEGYIYICIIKIVIYYICFN